MAKNLLIVESPAKAKTIEKILGKDFTVKSSFGHIRDLEKGNNAVDVKNGFAPTYVISPEKYKVVKDLKEWVTKAEEVWLATDEDREGEAISWHLCEVLKLNPRTTKRIVFHEITKPAIQKAIQQPRTVDLNLVNAQQARRILDRLVGFELSEILWKKIKGKLSAGRVQSVAVKLIVEREREIKNFESKPFYKLTAIFNVKNEYGKIVLVKAEVPERFDEEAEAKAFLQKCVNATFKIEDIEVKPMRRKPAAPFTTSTLQQEASRKMGFSVSRTMQTAQRLYEAGFITYMRTDSTNLSETALQSMAAEIEKNYGKQYVHTRQYKTKQATAQEAHEAIRPTYIENKTVTADRDEQRLYDLIWKRAIASQMADAELERTTARIGISTVANHQFHAVGEVLKFDGFLKVYLESKDEEEEEDTKDMLPSLKVGQPLELGEMAATERFTRPQPRYTEASLVKKLEEEGIGRPSTYAAIISKIMEEGRGYVIKQTKDGELRNYNVFTLKNKQITARKDSEMTGTAKNHLFATDIGMLVVDFLDQHFDKVMDYKFTANIEEEFDAIAEGKKEWKNMLSNFYHPFHALVEDTAQTAERATGERVLGKDTATGKTISVRMARFGPVVQIGQPEELHEEEKPRYANLKAGQSIETITIEQAMDLFQLPRTLGVFNGTEISVNTGRYGPYIKYNEAFISIPRSEDPLTITLSRAAELIQEKLDADAPISTYEGKPVTKGKGRFGPFIKWSDLYISIPKRYDFDNLSAADCKALIETKVEKEANRYVQRWEDLNISIENGRWGPYIKFGKHNIALKRDGKKIPNEEAAHLSLEEVKAIIEAEVPDAFAKKQKATAKKK